MTSMRIIVIILAVSRVQTFLIRPQSRKQYHALRRFKYSRVKFDCMYNPIRTPATLSSSTRGLYLDRSLIPSDGGYVMQKSLLIIAALFCFLQLLYSTRATIPTEKEHVNSDFISNFIQRVFLVLRTIRERICAFFSSLMDQSTDAQALDIDLKDWTSCTLLNRKKLGGDYFLYTFQLPNSRSKLSSLDVGQELILCCVDQSDRVLKEPVFPIMKSDSKGAFDVIIQRSVDGPADNFAKAVHSLSGGDELAFKGGKRKLNYSQDAPINFITLVASSAGVAPCLQILREILPDPDSTVEEIELLWLNEDKNDFVLDEEIRVLEKQYKSKLVASRFVDDDLYGLDFTKSDEILGSLSPYEDGRIAIVCAPLFLLGKVKGLFQDIGYPAENIMLIDTR